jgi:type I restriction enzyme S subunit
MVGTMAKIDDSVKKKAPELRFPGFTDDWEELKLIDIAENISDGDWIEANHIFDTGDYRIVQTGNIGIGSFLDKLQNAKYFYQADFDELKANEIFPGDILISRLSDPAGRTSILPDLGVRAVTAVDVAIIRPNDNFHAEFLVAELNSSTILAKVDSLASGSTRKRISRKNLESIQINLPTFEEQQKIGSFFKQLDDTIVLHQRKLDLLKEQKKGYLQKMFPKNGAKVPELRFAGFADDWEERKVGNFLSESKIKGSDGSVSKKLTVKLWRKGIVPKEEIYKGSSATQYYIRLAGQFMYGKLDFLNQAFGILPNELDGYESTLDSPAFDFKDGINPNFFLEYVCQENFYKYQGNIANGSRKAKRIHADTFFDMPIKIPSFEEQEKIGNFFKELDDAIALHQRKLDLLKEQKKGFLQKMFV